PSSPAPLTASAPPRLAPLTASAPPAFPEGNGAEGNGGVALVLSTLDEVRAAALRSADLSTVRAVAAAFVPSTAGSGLAREGIATLTVDPGALTALKGEKVLGLPPPAQWGDTVPATVGKSKVDVAWLATGVERAWTHAGTARTPPKLPGR